jgi:hypothetical protein
MKQLARNIFKAIGQKDYEIPDYTQIEDHNEAKQIMKEYLEDLIEQVGKESSDEVTEAVQEAQEILESELFIEQKGIRSLVDKDARVGHKSRTQNFYGYKAEICQTTDGGLITSITVEPGSYVDGSNFKEHIEEIQKSGLTLTGVYGDKAYFRPDILNLIKGKAATSYIPVSASAYKIDEELFSYNKDSDQWFCVMGNETVKVKSKTRERNGLNKTQIAEACGCSRTTVIQTLRLAKENRLQYPLPDSISDKQLAELLFPTTVGKPVFKMPDYEYVHRELQKNGVTLNLLWLEYCDACRTAGETPYQSTQFNKYYNDFLVKKDATMHLNHKPGEIMQVDWGNRY